MAVYFSVTLTCRACMATLRYEDERPPWQTYDYRVEHADECEKSARFVAEHADERIPPDDQEWPAWIEAGRPEFIMPERWTGRMTLNIPKPYRFVVCPVCDAQVMATQVRSPHG